MERAREIVNIIIRKNSPFDKKWLNQIKRQYEFNLDYNLYDWAKEQIEYCFSFDSEEDIKKASILLVEELF